MSRPKLSLLILITTVCTLQINAQADSSLKSLQQLSSKYFAQADKKITKYSTRLTSKTEKTVAKLTRWETKIRSLLHKPSPETEQRLFANEEMTFAGLQKKLQQGKVVAEGYTAQYNEYRDNLTMSLQFVMQQKQLLDSSLNQPVNKAAQKMESLEKDVQQSEAVQKFIRERKKQLIKESLKYIGNSKYLAKINKEGYYYTETLKNYKEIFSDSKKAEATAKELLNKIPAFKKFL
ncbi:hypothetical protein [Ferruginibacter sp. HRS2-29]|uniref:hypothetical protein n=1 Tax=Ferruginibacter sp. HRS2-29 TaxID=2487334 RepID=UPI0020CC422E|nr:hypothetical protein [Ferruginibacter sp. HRS2-29]MCP9749781.1 hypothetical protein [Ferruginibacter sp. HRS2-29]